jgi:hypothetical protein
MRIAVVTMLAMGLAAALAATAGAAGPTLRVVPGPSLTVQGTGFVPRTLVRLRVTSTGAVVRTAVVRTGAKGGFVTRFPLLEMCSATRITAAGVRDRLARVPTAWFVRECPPPPPLDPAPSPDY